MIYRLRDILFATILVAVLSWLILLIIFVLTITQKRVFFFQQRSGFQMRKFRLIKFSTLRDAAPGVPEEADQKSRLTISGRILRRFSFDEIPQLFNVLGGSMSLVGPRPLITDYDDLYSESDKVRFQVKPGITGWAQIHGRNSIGWKERFELDRWYVANRSMILDFKILLKTIWIALSGKGVFSDDRNTSPKYDGGN